MNGSSFLSGGSVGEMDTNFTPMRNLYPGAGGGTTATLGAAGSPDSFAPNYAGTISDETAPAVDTPAPGTVGGLAWWVGIAIVFGLILFTAKKTGQATEFSNVRISTYNVLFITLVAILGFTSLKVLAVKTRGVPLLRGFSDVVLAA